jgi:hypothetical protein
MFPAASATIDSITDGGSTQNASSSPAQIIDNMVDHIENQDSATSAATAASSDADAILLHTPMYLIPEAGTVRSLSSPTPFLINGVKVWSATPIYVYDQTPGRSLSIEPIDSLGPDFERGWNKLPDELKVHVLSFNLISNDGVRRLCTSPRSYVYESLAKHLQSTPEIANLSREIYWTKNTFLLECTITPRLGQRTPLQLHPPQSQFLAYPNLGVNGIMKRVGFHCSANPMELAHLLRFANGNYGFQDLRYVKVVFEMRYVSDRWEAAFRAALATGLRFACEGDLKVKLDRERDEHRKQLQQSLKELLLSSISFGCSKTKRGVMADPIAG